MPKKAEIKIINGVECKQCSGKEACKEWLPLSEFHIKGTCADGTIHYRSLCKRCSSKNGKTWNENNKERKAKTGKIWYENNKEHVAETCKKWCENNKERKAETKKKWNENNKEHIAETSKIWYDENKERKAETSKTWQENNKERIAETSKTWKENNKERIAETGKIWRENNKERKAETNKQWYKENKERVAETNKKWCENNKERAIETSKKWRNNNKERHAETNKKWCREDRAKNPEKWKIIAAKRKAARRGYGYDPMNVLTSLEGDFHHFGTDPYGNHDIDTVIFIPREVHKHNGEIHCIYSETGQYAHGQGMVSKNWQIYEYYKDAHPKDIKTIEYILAVCIATEERWANGWENAQGWDEWLAYKKALDAQAQADNQATIDQWIETEYK